MAIKTAIELEVKQPSLKGFKQELREAKLAAEQAVMTFGEFSPEAIKATERVAQLRDRMDDFNDRVAAVNPDKFAQLNTVVSSVANGFQAAQGAMVLLGGTTQNVEKTFVKLQAAMALSQGLEGLGKTQQQMKQLIASATTLQKAMVGVAGVIGLVAANFDTLVKFIPGLETVKNVLKEIGYTISDVLGLGFREAAQFKQIEKANKILEIELNKQIDILSAQYGKEDAIYAKRKELIQTRLNTVTEALRLEQYADEDAKQELLLQQKQFNADMDVLDAQETKRVEDGVRERTRVYEDYFDETQNIELQKEAERIARRELEWSSQFDLLNQSLDKETKLLTTYGGDYISIIKEREELALKTIEFQKAKELQQLQRNYDDQVRLLGVNHEDIEGLTQFHEERITAIELLYNQKRFKAEEESNKQRIDYEIKKDEQLKAAKIQIAESTVSSLNSLAQTFISNQEKLGKVQKGIALIEIGIDTAMAISSLNKEAATVSAQMAGVLGPATPIFTASYYAQGIARILANVAKAKQILSQPNATTGTASMSNNTSFSATTAPNMMTGSSLPQDIGGGKVYVLEGDITRVQTRMNRNRNVSVVE